MKTRIILFCSLVFCLNSTTRAQTDSLKARSRRYELGMSLYSFAIRGGDFYSGYKPVFDHSIFNGLYGKRYFGQNVLRASFGYMQKLVNLNKRYEYSPAGRVISSRSAQVAVGYQRLFGHRKLVPYVSCDVAAEYMRELRSSGYYDPLALPYIDYIYPYYGGNRTLTSLLLSVSPGIGLRMHVGKGIVLTAETQAQFYYALQNDNLSHRDYVIGINAKAFQLSLGFMF